MKLNLPNEQVYIWTVVDKGEIKRRIEKLKAIPCPLAERDRKNLEMELMLIERMEKQ